MEQWNGEQRDFAIKIFIFTKTMIVWKVQRGSSGGFFFNLGRHGQVPSKHAIKTWIKNFEETGSALKKKRTGQPRSAVLHRMSSNGNLNGRLKECIRGGGRHL
jgi:hypothetical protein